MGGQVAALCESVGWPGDVVHAGPLFQGGGGPVRKLSSLGKLDGKTREVSSGEVRLLMAGWVEPAFTTSAGNGRFALGPVPQGMAGVCAASLSAPPLPFGFPVEIMRWWLARALAMVFWRGRVCLWGMQGQGLIAGCESASR